MDDLAVPQHHRSGAHRARRHPLLVALVTVGAVAAASALLVWGLLASDVLGVGDELLDAGGAGQAPSAAPSGAVVAPSDPAVPGGGATSAVLPSAAPSVTPSAPESSPEPPPATPDSSLPLTVLNSTSTPGLAATAAEALGDAGWQVEEVGNYDGDEIPTAVLYPEAAEGSDDEDDVRAAAVVAATAAAVAEDLGAGEATASPDVEVLTVVLGPDYEP